MGPAPLADRSARLQEHLHLDLFVVLPHGFDSGGIEPQTAVNLLIASELLPEEQQMLRFFSGDPEHTRDLMEVGILPWWTVPDAKAEFFQPLFVQTVVLDYRALAPVTKHRGRRTRSASRWEGASRTTLAHSSS